MNSSEVQLRFLNHNDIDELKQLCKEWFPIEYPDSWYKDITSNIKFYAVACVISEQIVGILVAEIKVTKVTLYLFGIWSRHMKKKVNN